MAIPFVLEDLETSQNPYIVAAAAKALRGAEDDLPASVVPALLAAVERIRTKDDRFLFDCSGPTANRPKSALQEVFQTFTWLGAKAQGAAAPLTALRDGTSVFAPDVTAELRKAVTAVAASATHACCASRKVQHETRSSPDVDLATIEVQDQDGTTFPLGAYIDGRVSVIAFFYTRCMNPEKCSLTITKLARLQKRVADVGLDEAINIAALTYDPDFDLPNRLRAYGTDRGLRFDHRTRLLRTIGHFEPLQRAFALGVGYGPSTINQHSLDLVVLDRGGKVQASFSRVQWRDDEVLAALTALSKRIETEPTTGGPMS
ncbi:SCO family protein [Beijerinckia sp. L45]|uniref:SCO family protein n=1 Tax=Beijerinckia sp. L45 TaxID=1641855 RepID=UPI00131A9350|nr:SCO family protein [Beijerinckia sp. L45]